MGASPSVSSRKKQDSFAVEEQKRHFQNKIIQAGVDYCREHLFTESPMSVTKAGDRIMVLRVDESRLDEMTNPQIGRLGAPFLVTLNTFTGNMFVQLFPERRSQRQSSLDPASIQSPATPVDAQTVGGSSTPSPRTPVSPTMTPSRLRPSTAPLSPLLPPSESQSPGVTSSPSTRTRPSYMRQRSNQSYRSQSSGGPSTPKKTPLALITTSKRVIFGAALMARTDVPQSPTAPRMVEQSPNHITVEWCSPIDDGGLVEKYEVEFRKSHRDPHSTEPSSDSVRSLFDQHVLRNPSKFGWKKLRTLYWYEWSYRHFEENEEEDEEAFHALFRKQQEREMRKKRKELYPGLYPEDYEEDIENENEGDNGFVGYGGVAGGGCAYGLRADLRGLKPATCFEFRVRAANHYGHSAWSEISSPIQSSPTPPGQPSPPFAVHTSGDAMWLSWMHPELNGLPLEVFELTWHIPGGGNSNQNQRSRGSNISSTNNSGNSSSEDQSKHSIILSAGSSNGSSFFLRRLVPRTTYSLTLRARNAAGWSPYSSPVIMTTTRYASDITSLDRSAPGLSQENWWVERYDGRSRTAFLFNVLTGERRTHGASSSSSSSLVSRRNSAPPHIITNPDQLERDEYYGGRGGGHSILVAEGGGENDDDDYMDNLFQTTGPELDFMKKRRKLHRALLMNMKTTSSTSTPSIVNASNTPVDNSAMALNDISATTINNNDSKFLWMRTNRSAVLSSMIARFSSWDVKLLKMKRIKVAFEGEDGIDSGGLGKDFFASVAKELLAGGKTQDSREGGGEINNQINSNNSQDLYKGQPIHNVEKVNGHSTSVSVSSGGGGGGIKYFTPTPSGGGAVVEIASGGGGSSGAWRAIGRFLGKSIIDRQLVPGLNLSQPLLKQLLKQPVGIDDLIGVDDVLYKSLHWTLHNSIEGVLDETFTVMSGGEEMELCEGGRYLKVTDDNKQKYVELRVSWYFQFRHMEELDNFVSGFVELVPSELLAPFELTELERLFVGTSEIDVDDIRAFTVFGGEFTCSDACVLWFWEYWKAQPSERKGKLLDFITASTRVPLDGFDPPFCIVSGGRNNDELPRSHTCFNQLVLPMYDNYDIMAQKLDLAVDHGSEGFFAT